MENEYQYDEGTEFEGPDTGGQVDPAAVLAVLEQNPELIDGLIEQRSTERAQTEAADAELREALENAEWDDGASYYQLIGKRQVDAAQATAHQKALDDSAYDQLAPTLDTLAETHYPNAVASLTEEEQAMFSRENFPDVSTQEYISLVMEVLASREAELTGQAAPTARAVAGAPDEYADAGGNAGLEDFLDESGEFDSDRPGWYAPEPTAFTDFSQSVRAELQDSD